MSILNDLLDKKLGLTSTATDPAIGTEARDEKSKLSVLLDSYLTKDTPEVTETKLGGVTSTPVSAEKMQVSNKAEADLRKKQEYLALSNNERWLHDRAYPTEFLSLLDESDLSPTKPAMQMSPNSWASSGYTSRPRTKGEIFEANLKKLSKGDPLRQKVEKIRTIQQQYQDKLVKDGVIEKPHEYQGLWDEVKWLSGEAGKGAASMSLRGIGAASRQLANVSEGAIWNPENFEAYAQKFRSLSQHESLQPDPAKGISKVGGFVASSIGQALPYMAASTGAFLLTGTPIASFGVGFVVEGDEAYQFALENGASEEQAQMNRLIVGTINGAIESLQVSNIIKFAKSEKAGYRALVKAAQQKAWSDVRKIGKDLTYEQLEHVLRESLEEALQETTTIAAEADVTGELDASEAVKRVGGSALGGGVVGLGFGLGGRGARAATGKESQLGPQTIKKLYEKAAARQTGPETDVGEQIPPISEAVDTSDLPPVLEQKPTQIPETQEVKTKKPEVETPSKPQTAPIPEPEAGQRLSRSLPRRAEP